MCRTRLMGEEAIFVANFAQAFLRVVKHAVRTGVRRWNTQSVAVR